jgi:hypothetical protein
MQAFLLGISHHCAYCCTRLPAFPPPLPAESTWKKVRPLLRHPKLAGLRRVQLPPEACTTEFTWRRGDGSFRGAVDEGLSSIEAIHQCCR